MSNGRKTPVTGYVPVWVRELMDLAVARGDYISLSEITRVSLIEWAQEYRETQRRHVAFLAEAHRRANN